MQPKPSAGGVSRPTGEDDGMIGERLGDARVQALRQRLISDRSRKQDSGAAATAKRLAKLKSVVRRFDALPVLDDRGPDEIIGYDEDGLPT